MIGVRDRFLDPLAELLDGFAGIVLSLKRLGKGCQGEDQRQDIGEMFCSHTNGCLMIRAFSRK